MARIPTCRKDHAVVKLEQLYKEWLTLKKHKTRKSDLHRCNEEKCCAKMNYLFDIAHADVATIIKISEDLEFLAAQREPGRRGYMGAIDTVLAKKEERKAKRIAMEMVRQERAMKQAEEQASASSVLEEVSNSSDEVHDSDPNDTVECSSSLPSRKRLRASNFSL